MPDGFGQGEWVGNITIHPVGVVILLVCVLFTFVNKRSNALLPFVFLLCFVSPAQRVVVATIDFNFFRLLLVLLFFRILINGEYKHIRVCMFDKFFAVFVLVKTSIYLISSGNLGDPLGSGGDIFIVYFVGRCLIRSTKDFEVILRFLALLSIPVCALFVVENTTGRNLFSVFGGVPEYTKVRDGRLRCQGAFPHPIIAGCFWAVLFPLFVGAISSNKRNLIFYIACVCSVVIVVTTASSTPLLSLLSAVILIVMYMFRKHLRKIRWATLLILVSLHLVMTAPVWHLISRVGAVGGSTGYFRFLLIDSFISRFNEWALLGTNYTGHWFFGAQDLANEFVLMGVRSGFLGLSLFVVVIALSFKYVGRSLHLLNGSPNIFFIWCIGVSLTVHCISFIGVSYFGQPVFLFYLMFPVIFNVYIHNLQKKKAALLERREV
ncbi:hypothetical protein [Amphritea sp. HPY]|uniref:hypothetical protein n=1 Tax=Amphritea sp. HPY TaxID=3421652 RepID=UPI003D7F0B76